MSEVTLVTKQCTKNGVHQAHRWWSRRQHCYFHCFGRREPRFRPPKDRAQIPAGGDLTQ